MPNWLQYSLKTKNFPLFWSHTLKYNIQANERLTKVKEKWETIKFDVFVLSFIFFVPMFQTTSIINLSGKWYFLHASNSGTCAGVCVCDQTYQMEKTSMQQSIWHFFVLLFGYMLSLWNNDLEVVHQQGLSVDYGSNNNMLKISWRGGVDGLPFWLA